MRKRAGRLEAAEGCALRAIAFNVKYSENVGDGVIAECMEECARDLGSEIVTFDLAGRSEYGERTVPARLLVMKMLAMLPRPLRRRIVRARLSRSLAALRERWRAALQQADLAIIGGGNLLQDDDLNFPLKVGAALDLAAEVGVPVRVHAVGAVPGWSEEARECLARLRDRAVRITVRDEASRDALRKELGREDIGLAKDPGLLAGLLIREHRERGRQSSEAPRVGIGIIHPAVVSRHAHGAPRPTTRDFADMVVAAAARGWRVSLFTNGAAEDQRELEAVHALLEPEVASRTEKVERPTDPRMLARTIAGFDGVVAHRLHACILAYALDRPAIGLAWDEKVRSFFRLTGRERFVMSPGDGAEIVARLAQALESGHDGDTRSAEIGAARENLADALASGAR